MQEDKQALHADLYQRCGDALPPLQRLHCHRVDGQHKAAGCAEDVAGNLHSMRMVTLHPVGGIM